MRVVSVEHQDDAPSGVFGETTRELGHELVVWRPDRGEAPPDGFDAAMVFGGAMNVDDEGDHAWLRPEKEWLRDLIDSGTPLMGVCLGAQLVADAAGATVARAPEPEIGWYEVDRLAEADGDAVLGDAPTRFCAFEWHSYRFDLPPGAAPLARRGDGLQAYRIGDSCWAIQFHAEVTSETASQWTRDYESDPDAVRMGIDPDVLATETERRIGAWNQFGRGLAERFLRAAQR